MTQFAQLGPGPARTIERLGLIGPNGLLQHLTGDIGVQVGPGNSGLLPVSGTVMIGVDDAGAVQSWLDDHLPVLLRQAGIPGLPSRTLKTEEYQGVKITYGAVPTTGAWGVVNGALVLGLTPNAVEQAVDLAAGAGSVDQLRRRLLVGDRWPSGDPDAPLRGRQRHPDCGAGPPSC